MTPSRLTLLTATAGALLAALPAAQPPDAKPKSGTAAGRTQEERERRMQEEAAAVSAREQRIDAELTALDRSTLKEDDWAREWAGTYYVGDGLGMNVSIKVAPKSGITYMWHGCLGLYDCNHGDIVERFPGGLKIRLALEESASTYGFMSSTLYFVRWGERRYLVPESQMMELVNNYNEGGYARDSLYGAPRKYEEGREVRRLHDPAPPGRPELPERYAKLLIAAPMRLRVTKVTPKPVATVTGQVRVLECDLEFEGGSDQGVFVGMEFMHSKADSGGTVRITRVDASTCTATAQIFGSDPKAPAVDEVIEFPGSKTDPTPDERPAAEPKER